MMSGKHPWRSVWRWTGRDPDFTGHWLHRHCRTERLRPAQLARKLGLGQEGLMLLCLCRTPRADHFLEDLDVICRRTSADPATLALILRQEQTLARWTEGAAPSSQGWLAAASDAPAEDPSDDSLPEAPDEG